MKGYGLPRNDDVQHPDKGDIGLYGLNISKLNSKRKNVPAESGKKSKDKRPKKPS